MKRLILSLILTGMVAAAQDNQRPVYKDIDTGNGFLRNCSALENESMGKLSEDEMFDVAYCLGYLGGLTDGMEAIQIAARYNGFCLPVKDDKEEYAVENGQILKVFFKFIHEHPDILHKSTRLLFFKAMSEAYPCRKPSKKPN